MINWEFEITLITWSGFRDNFWFDNLNLQKKVASADVLKLCLEWTSDIIRNCESSLHQLMQNKAVVEVIGAVIQLGYHHLHQVTSSVASCLIAIVDVLPTTQVNYNNLLGN